MTEWGAEQFAAFFEGVWGHPPFAWQAELARRVLAAPAGQQAWPEAIALPTASGKTACLDVAVYALAAQAGRTGTAGLRAPRRIFFVVDRRVIVDEAHQRAEHLADQLARAQDGVLKEVADRLRIVAGSGQDALPLAVQALRGGLPRSDDWAATPLQPTIIASTVDQVGSRLLFRAYGPLSGMWPVHAALVGNDALILLDEAHCAQPMLQTLRAVQRYRGWAAQPVPVPFEVSVLSATPPAHVEPARVFHDTSGEGRDPSHPLGRRQLAAKPARLELAGKAKGRHAAQRRAAMAQQLAEHARALAVARVTGLAGAPAVVVFCNRVDTARQVCARLRAHGAEVHLLTGRMRPIDKDDVLADKLALLATGRAGERCLDQPTFVVTTQTLEVGANLDFDLLVTECASLDALRQRFGRLNRSGRPIDARAVIVAAAHDAEATAPDAVYGEALHCTWAWLQAQVGEGEPVVDFGIAALAPRLPTGDELMALNAPAPNAPVLLPAHLDMLAQTAPVPVPSPDAGLFLHGPQSGPGDVRVCWRADLGTVEQQAARDALQLTVELLLRCPPSTPECLAVPYAQARRWLDNLPAPAGADVEGSDDADESLRGQVQALPPRRALRWRGRENSAWLEGGDDLRPGDVLVLPAVPGGFNELGTLGDDPVADWGDRAHAALHRDAVLRLHPALLAAWPAAVREPLADWLAKPVEAAQQWEQDPAAFAAALRDLLRICLAALRDGEALWLSSLLQRAVQLGRRLEREIVPHPWGGWIIVLPQLPRVAGHGIRSTAAFFGDEDDAASSGRFRSLLIEAQSDGHSHLSGVGALAGHYARLCGLAPLLAQAIQLSGDGHDLGKADPRFQSWLRNGVPWVTGPLLAKSAEFPQGQQENRAARERAGYPEGGRHELLSVRLLESNALALPPDDDLRELMLHLVGSHHGHCRPLAPLCVDSTPVLVQVQVGGLDLQARSDTGLERIDAGPADRFWRLTRRHGWWGLAWLESLLRLADHRRSEWEQRHSHGEGA